MLQGGLRTRRPRFEQEDVNPMEGAINIVDAMLVFACGLMLSLVIYWNVDIQNREYTEIEQGREISPVEGIDDSIASSVEGAGDYQKMGTVYYDPETGKMYLAADGKVGVDENAQDAEE